MEPLINEIEAARRLGLSVRSLQKGRCTATGAGAIPYVQLGRRVMYEPEAIAAHVAAGRRFSTSQGRVGA